METQQPERDRRAVHLQRAWVLIPAVVVVAIILVIAFRAFGDANPRGNRLNQVVTHGSDHLG